MVVNEMLGGPAAEKLVDVTGFEPAIPCLQIQKAKLDDVKKSEKE
jgi:hypothetical protein